MRALPLLVFALVGCPSDNPYDQGQTKIDTADTDADADTDIQECPSSYDPVDQTSWTRSYSVTYNGKPTTGEQQGIGAATDYGVSGFQFRDAVTGSNGWDITTFVSCEGDDGDGMYQYGWEGDVSLDMMGFPMEMVVTATDSPPRLYLPSDAEIGYRGSWAYDYTLIMDTSDGKQYTGTVSGTYQEVGWVETSLPTGETVEAYKLANSYHLSISSAGMEMDGYIEQLWVKGLGLVSESNYDLSTGDIYMSRELTSYSGLTPQ